MLYYVQKKAFKLQKLTPGAALYEVIINEIKFNVKINQSNEKSRPNLPITLLRNKFSLRTNFEFFSRNPLGS